MSKNFKADLSAVTDEVPSQLTVDAGALAERVSRGQRRHKVAASALSVLLVTGLGFGGYTVLSTLNHDSEPAAPLPSESQIVWDRPGVGDYNPACGAVWDPPSAAASNVFTQRGLDVTLEEVEIIESDLKTHLETTLHAITSFDISLPADSEMSLGFGLERYVYLTKDSVVVARSGHGATWPAIGLHLPGEKEIEYFGDVTQFDVPLIDCTTEEPLSWDGSDMTYYETGEPLPAGTYQLHGHLPNVNLSQNDLRLAEGDLWVGPALVTIPASDQGTAPVTAPADLAEAAAYNPTCGAIWDPAMTVDDDVFVEHGVRITLGDGGVVVPQPGWSPALMSATAMTNLDLSTAQDLSIIFTPGSYAYLTKDSVVVALSTSDHGGLIPGTKLPYEQKHSEDLGNEGTWLGLTLADCNLVEDGTAANQIPDEALLPAGEYLLYGKVQAELVRGGEVLGSGTIWTSPARILIPEQPELPTSDS